MARLLPIIMSRGEEREKAIKEFNELLKVFEEGINKDFPEEFPFFERKTLGYLDIVVGAHFCNYEAFHEVVAVQNFVRNGFSDENFHHYMCLDFF